MSSNNSLERTGKHRGPLSIAGGSKRFEPELPHWRQDQSLGRWPQGWRSALLSATR